MIQIIPRDIHIKKWEKFQVDVQLKFLTWFTLIYFIEHHSNSLNSVCLNIYFLLPFNYSLNSGLLVYTVWPKSLSAFLILSIPRFISFLFLSFFFSAFTRLSMYCFFPYAFFTIVCAAWVPGSNLRIINGGCSFLIFLVFSLTFCTRSFSNFCLNLSGISSMSTSFSNL